MKHIEELEKVGACGSAIRWASEMKNGQSAWDNCERGDWMLWLAGKMSGKPESAKRKRLVLCACECARLALVHVSKGELRPLKAIETAEAWARGKATIEEVRKARSVAVDAAYAAVDAAYAAVYAADAVYAAYAAAYAAYAADAACAAADAADDAVDDADAADDAAHKETLKKCADIVRKHYPKVPVVKQ